MGLFKRSNSSYAHVFRAAAEPPAEQVSVDGHPTTGEDATTHSHPLLEPVLQPSVISTPPNTAPRAIAPLAVEAQEAVLGSAVSEHAMQARGDTVVSQIGVATEHPV